MRNLLLAGLTSLLLTACGGVPLRPDSTVPLARDVNLARFMGDWYVIAHIPTDRDATSHNAMENYTLNADGSIATTYRNRLLTICGGGRVMFLMSLSGSIPCAASQ